MVRSCVATRGGLAPRRCRQLRYRTRRSRRAAPAVVSANPHSRSPEILYRVSAWCPHRRASVSSTSFTRRSSDIPPCRADMQEMRPFLDDLRQGNFRRALTENRVFKSIFRTGYPSTPRNQALIMFNNVFLHLHPVRIRRESLKITYTFCLGGLSFFLFLLLTVTGVLLMFYYRPATAVAYQDMKDLETVVTFGLLLRNLHRYAAHGMVITVFLHMVRVFYTGAYKAPREFNWI